MQSARERIHTTGQAAFICGVSQQTIIRAFDRGELNGFKIGRDRRIPHRYLLQWMEKIGVPLEYARRRKPSARAGATNQ